MRRIDPRHLLYGGLFLVGMGLLFFYIAFEQWRYGRDIAAMGWTSLALFELSVASGMLISARSAMVRDDGDQIPAPRATVELREVGEDFVELLRSNDLAQIHLLKGTLEANGVQVWLQDAEASSVFGGIPGFSTKLLVGRSDALRAKALIDRTGG